MKTKTNVKAGHPTINASMTNLSLIARPVLVAPKLP